MIVERLLDGEKEVEVDLLGSEADRLARLAVMANRVMTEDLDLAARYGVASLEDAYLELVGRTELSRARVEADAA